MKRFILILVCFAGALLLAACGSAKASQRGGGTQSVYDTLIEEMLKEDGSSKKNGTPYATRTPVPTPVEHITPEEARNEEEGIDVDLTKLSATLVYAEVYNMMCEPEKYIGKTVKMSGDFRSLHDEAKDIYYFACIIKDATACCAQGIEFVLTDEYRYPDDYPEENGIVTVVGVFDTYQEGSDLYCTLRNAKLL